LVYIKKILEKQEANFREDNYNEHPVENSFHNFNISERYKPLPE
jgi:hypothetical protein